MELFKAPKPRETDLRAVVKRNSLHSCEQFSTGCKTVRRCSTPPSPVHKMGFLLKPSTRMPGLCHEPPTGSYWRQKSDDEADVDASEKWTVNRFTQKQR